MMMTMRAVAIVIITRSLIVITVIAVIATVVTLDVVEQLIDDTAD
jgi:hypothetical protein